MNDVNNEANPIIKIKGLSFFYEESEVPAVNDIDLEIISGTVNVILGPSGCGKTTLCRCLTGVIPNAYEGRLSGQLLFKDEDLSGQKLNQISKKVGLVMQEPDNQIVSSTVEDDVAFGPENMMIDPVEIRKTVDYRLDEVKLTGFEENSPNRISGGEKQRTIIAGILALDPEVIVFDEPMSSLDEKSKIGFSDTVKTVSKEGKTVIIVEHDFHRLSFADNWIIMKNGRIITEGKPDDIDKDLLEDKLWL